MAEGFFITDAGTHKIAVAANQGIKVDINTVAVGSGGDINAEYDYSIKALNNEIYRKTFDENDHYEIDPGNDNIIVIEFTIPDTAGELNDINEVGIFEKDGTLISYGTLQNIDKHVGTEGNLYTVVLAVYIPFTNNDLEHINLVIGTDGLRQLEYRVGELEGRVDGHDTRLDTLETNEDRWVEKQDGFWLSSNDFTDQDQQQIETNKENITEIMRELSSLASNENFVNLERRVATNEGNISTLQTTVKGLPDRVSSLEETLSGLAATLESLI